MAYSAHLAAGLCAARALGSAAQAQQIRASDPEGLHAWIVSEGIPAKLETDSLGDPMVSVRYFSSSFEVFFYGCSNNTECQSIQFFSGYQSNGSVDAEKMNEWNTAERYSRAYVTEGGAVVRLEYDVYLGADGMSARDFDQVFDTWIRAFSDFEEFIDW